jgi:hypothetical protein
MRRQERKRGQRKNLFGQPGKRIVWVFVRDKQQRPINAQPGSSALHQSKAWKRPVVVMRFELADDGCANGGILSVTA